MKRFRQALKYGVPIGGGAVMVSAGSAHAVNLWDPIVTAAALDGLSTAQITMLAVVILFPLGFAAYRLIAGGLHLIRSR